MNSAGHFDRLIDILLSEELGGRRPPDLTARILARAFARRQGSMAARISLAAASVVLALVGVYFGWLRYPPPAIESGALQSEGALRRGATATVMAEATVLRLGGYCRLQFAAESEFRLEGAERQEQIHLAKGEVECEVERRRGTFAVRTALGDVHATGTRFRVRVGPAEGGETMETRRMAAGLCLAVAVMAGSVRVDHAGRSYALAAGQSQVFGGETVKSEDPPAQRTPGRDGERNAIARGVVIGVVKAKGEAWVEITSVSGKTEKYIPEWEGGMPQRGGGPNRRVCEMISRVIVGDRVKAHWYVNDHLRLAAIERLSNGKEASAQEGDTSGFAGMLAGKIKERSERGVKIEVLRIEKVWKHSQARKPEALAGKVICLRVDPSIYARKDNGEKYRNLVLAFFASLAPGQEEVFDVKHLEGDNFLFLELTEEQRRHGERLLEGGEVTGTIVAKERHWLEVRPDGGGLSERYMARWIGGMPQDGGGPDRAMLEAIARVQIGERVRLRWVFEERKRVIALESLGTREGGAPKAAPAKEENTGTGAKDAWEDLRKALR